MRAATSCALSTGEFSFIGAARTLRHALGRQREGGPLLRPDLGLAAVELSPSNDDSLVAVARLALDHGGFLRERSHYALIVSPMSGSGFKIAPWMTARCL